MTIAGRSLPLAGAFSAEMAEIGRARADLAGSRLHTLGPWAVWLAASVATFWLVAAHGFTMPHGDEWAWLPVVAGQQPVTAEWLWSQHNEHRMVLPRLIYMGLGGLTDFDFRAGSFYNVALLSGLAALMMVTARRLRGRSSLSDAFFPLLLLNWAQFINLGWGFQLNFVTSVALAGVLLVLAVRCGRRLTVSAALAATVCLLGLGLCGAYGLVYVPAGAAWLAFAGAARWKGGGAGSRLDGLAMLAMAGVSLGFVGVYMMDFHGPGGVSPNVWASASTAIQFLAGGLGPAAKETWPVSGLVVAGGLALSLRQMFRAAVDRPAERVRVIGLLCFLAGLVSLAVAIGVGRAQFGPRAGFIDRFMTIALPLLCLFFLQTLALGAEMSARRICRALALVMCVLAAINAGKGLRYASRFEGPMAMLEADVRAGLPSDALAVRYAEPLGFNCDAAEFAGWMDTLRLARLGPYRNLGDRRPDGRLAVERLAAARQQPEPLRTVRIAAGESLLQSFWVEAPARLERIDVEMKKWRWGRWPDRLDWTLRRIGADGAVAVAGGQVDLDRLARYEYATLRLDGLWVGESTRFELAIETPADTPAGLGAEIPLFERAVEVSASAGAVEAEAQVKGFLFLARGEALASRPAEGSGEVWR